MKRFLLILLSVILLTATMSISVSGEDNGIIYLPSGDRIVVTKCKDNNVIVEYYSETNHYIYDSTGEKVCDYDTGETIVLTSTYGLGDSSSLDLPVSNPDSYVVADPGTGGTPGYYWYRSLKIKKSWVKETQSKYTNISISNKNKSQILQSVTVLVVGLLTQEGFSTGAIGLFLDTISPWVDDIVYKLNAVSSGNEIVYNGSARIHTVYFHWSTDSSQKTVLTEGIASDWSFVGFLKVAPNLIY